MPQKRYRKLGMLVEHLETRTWEMQALKLQQLTPRVLSTFVCASVREVNLEIPARSPRFPCLFASARSWAVGTGSRQTGC